MIAVLIAKWVLGLSGRACERAAPFLTTVGPGWTPSSAIRGHSVGAHSRRAGDEQSPGLRRTRRSSGIPGGGFWAKETCLESLTRRRRRATVATERERCWVTQSSACTLAPWDRDVNGMHWAPAGRPHTHRHPSGERPGVTETPDGAAWSTGAGARDDIPTTPALPTRAVKRRIGGRRRPRGQTSGARMGAAAAGR
jgi:hypothetical protein